jgi:hypothetical protein
MPSNTRKPAQCRAKTDASVVPDGVLAAGKHDSSSRKSASLIKPQQCARIIGPGASWTARGVGDGPIRKSRDEIVEGPPSFKERQDILNHEVARQVHDGTDNDQRERESDP